MQCMHASTYFDSPRLTYSTEEQMHLHALIFIQDPTFIQVLPFTSSLQALAFIHSKKTPSMCPKLFHLFQALTFIPSYSICTSQGLPFVPSSPIHFKLFLSFQGLLKLQVLPFCTYIQSSSICYMLLHSFQVLPFITNSSIPSIRPKSFSFSQPPFHTVLRHTTNNTQLDLMGWHER